MNLIVDVKPINPYNDCILRKIIFFQYLSTSIGLMDQMGAVLTVYGVRFSKTYF